MEGRLRPSPIRREESTRSPANTEARSYALALKALQDRIATLEADNQLLRDKLSSAQNHTNREIERLKAQLEAEKRSKEAESASALSACSLALQQETAASMRWQAEAGELQRQCEQLTTNFTDFEQKQRKETQEWQLQVEYTRAELGKAQGRIAAMERELQEPFMPPISPVKAESEDGKEELKREKEELRRALEESEAGRLMLLQHQIKSQAVLDDIIRMNGRLVSVLHRFRKAKSIHSPRRALI